jgi:hypothetical protein
MRNEKLRLTLEMAKTKLINDISYFVNKYYSSTSNASRSFYTDKIKTTETRLKNICNELEKAYRI